MVFIHFYALTVRLLVIYFLAFITGIMFSTTLPSHDHSSSEHLITLLLFAAMLETTFDDFCYWRPVWMLSLFPFLGIAFLFFVEKWLLSSPNTIPWVGEKTVLFPRISACLRDKKNSVSGLKAGYFTVSSSFSHAV